MAVRVPDQVLDAVLTAMLAHPNVDFVAANMRRIALPADAPPIGTNPADLKHSVHFVGGAWDHTRGSSTKTAKIGILDSGFAADVTAGTYHPDGLELPSAGIVKKGFVDNIGGCSSSSQDQGLCLPYDDHYRVDQSGNLIGGHGSAMAGLAGGNDNDLGYVGIMPWGYTHSMKIAFNPVREGNLCGFEIAYYLHWRR